MSPWDALGSCARFDLQLFFGTQAEMLIASDNNPGIPPSSLFAWLKVLPAVKGVVLTDFDSAFRNRFFDSRFDGDANVDLDSIAAAAAGTAAALHSLAAGPTAPPLKVRYSNFDAIGIPRVRLTFEASVHYLTGQLDQVDSVCRWWT